MTSDETDKSLGITLDQLLEQAESEGAPSFRVMAQAAGLDPSCDFVGASLRDMDFRDEDLRGFDFSNADLTGADFRRAKVEGVTFHGAELLGAIGLDEMPEAASSTILPRVSANLLSGLLEALAAEPYNGKADLPVIADELHMEADELFPVSDALQILHFVEVEGGDIKLSETGKQFVEAGTDDRKKIFQRQLLTYVPLAAHIRRVLQERANHVAPKSRFFDELEDHMSTDDAEQTLRAVTAWGRYAEAFAYDDDSQMFSLENPI